jgi:lysyl-tRNA synthetase class 2
MSEQEQPPEAPDENQIIAERRGKLARLREQGQAYPNDFKRNDVAIRLDEAHGEKTREALDEEKIEVTLAGRMMLKRVMGKASFAALQDFSGRIQLFISNDDTGEAVHAAFKHYDVGDILGVKGTLFKTKTGELTVRVKELRLLTKSLRPMPEKFHGLTNQEQKYRQRYVDLAMNEHSRWVFVIRNRTIDAIRRFMKGRNYLEVETPMMHPIPGGASARPFRTHHNALDMDLFLRIAPELYLKRLLVGGMEKIFEINRNFRNEGISPRHNPEFTMLEFYACYADYRYLMSFTELLFAEIAMTALGTDKINYQGREIDLGRSYHRFTITQAICHYCPQYLPDQMGNADYLRLELARLKVDIHRSAGLGTLQLALFEATTESLLFEPTFIIDYPAEVSPLARRSDTNPQIAERFELFIAGREIANGFSELNDPEDQARRFQEQAQAKDAGDEEAMYYDADYIRALEYGMPPAAGEGIGIDRLVMLLTDSPNIRDVILFPQMRPEI